MLKLPTPGSIKTAPRAATSAAAAAAAKAGRPAPKKKFSMRLSEHQSLNDGAFRDLPVGRFVYKITSLTNEPVKSDPTGKKYKISLGLNRYTPEGEDDKYVHNFNVCGDSEAAREIAFKGIKALALACEIGSEEFSEDQFPHCVDNDITLEVKASTKIDPATRKPVTRLNLNRIDKPKEEDYHYLYLHLYPDGQVPEGEVGEAAEEASDEQVDGTTEETAAEETGEQTEEPAEEQTEEPAEEQAEEDADETAAEEPAKPVAKPAPKPATKPGGKAMPWDKKK